MELTIRPYAEADFDAVTTVWFASWASTEVGLPNPAIRAELRERLPREIAGDWTVYVAMAGTDIVGFLALQERRFQQLFVAPTMQSRGVGKQLLDFVKAKRPEGFYLTTPTEGGDVPISVEIRGAGVAG